MHTWPDSTMIRQIIIGFPIPGEIAASSVLKLGGKLAVDSVSDMAMEPSKKSRTNPASGQYHEPEDIPFMYQAADTLRGTNICVGYFTAEDLHNRFGTRK